MMRRSTFLFFLCGIITFCSGVERQVKADNLATLREKRVVHSKYRVEKVKTSGKPIQSGYATVPDLTPIILMNDLNFNSASAGTSRDFIVSVNEVNNVSTQGTITFRLFKASAFTIAYSPNSGNSDVYPGVANSNSDWDFSETDNYITVTSRAGVSIQGSTSKIVGFKITRKADVPENTIQNITASIVSNSGGEQQASNNISGVKVNATNSPLPLDFSIAADSVKLNPYGYTPLSAQISFAISALGKTFIRVHGKHGKLTHVEHTFDDRGLRHSIPLIGLYANYNNTVDVRVVGASGDTLAKSTFTVQTGDLPPNMPISIVSSIVDETKINSDLILVSNYSTRGTSSPMTPYLLDAYGEIRWVLDYRTHPVLRWLNYDVGINRLKNGNFFFGDTSPTIPAIYEVDLLGKVINNWGLSGYIFHHEVSEKPDGNFLLTASKPGSTYKDGVSPTIEDFVIEINRQNGALVNVWDLKESLDETRTSLTVPDGVQPASDWFHGNAVEYDPADNTIVVSGRSQGVVKLDYNNRVKWILSAHKGWTSNRRGENLNQFLLKPLDSSGNPIPETAVAEGTSIATDFEWNWYQHNINKLPNGDWMLFDNGAVREFNPASPKYSRSVIYRINPANMTVQQIWTYGKERGTSTYSQIVSSSQFLSQANHVLFGPGYQVPTSSGQGSKIVEIDFLTKQVVSEISITSANNFGHHRAKKMSAYP